MSLSERSLTDKLLDMDDRNNSDPDVAPSSSFVEERQVGLALVL